MIRTSPIVTTIVCAFSCAAFSVAWSSAAIAGQSDADSDARRPFVIEVVDAATGRGVPLIELETTGGIRYVTDSKGIVAFDEPGLLGETVFFHVRGHGYEFPADGFGFRGRRLDTKPGGRARIEVRRINVAERLYRITGHGIYRDSILAGEPVPTRRPALNAQVIGSDSVFTAIFRGKIWWFWGDTSRVSYPLGNFHTTGATSELPGRGGLDPSVGVDLDYFTGDDGFARPMAKLPGNGPTWISGTVVLRDPSGAERLFAHYVKIRNQPGGGFETDRNGIAELDPETARFEHVSDFPDSDLFPHGGHAFIATEDGVEWVYLADPYPVIRVRADPASYSDPASYEAFTCLAPGVTHAKVRRKDGNGEAAIAIDRDASGKVRWGWKRGTAPVRGEAQEKLIRSGLLERSETPFALRDVDTGKAVVAFRGSVYFNDYRKRWVMIAGEGFGSSSVLGEIWYAEADRPLGPWLWARKIITHDRYSFYNPKHHPFFDEDGGRRIYLEGTYTESFSGNPVRTPRYDYNQILYRLDLDDPRVNLPVAVYALRDEDGNAADFRIGSTADTAALTIAFWALERPREGAVAVYREEQPGGGIALRVDARKDGSSDARGDPLFYAFEPEGDAPFASLVPLWAHVHADTGRTIYSTSETVKGGGFKRAEKPLVRVWPHPLEELPTGGHVVPVRER